MVTVRSSTPRPDGGGLSLQVPFSDRQGWQVCDAYPCDRVGGNLTHLLLLGRLASGQEAIPRLIPEAGEAGVLHARGSRRESVVRPLAVRGLRFRAIRRLARQIKGMAADPNLAMSAGADAALRPAGRGPSRRTANPVHSGPPAPRGPGPGSRMEAGPPVHASGHRHERPEGPMPCGVGAALAQRGRRPAGAEPSSSA